jgi:proteasome lid subunit RPN8/RPN11
MSADRGGSAAELGARLQLGPQLLAAMREHAEATYPEEACGGLLGRADSDAVEVVEVVSLANVREAERRRRYLIGPDDVMALERRAEARGLQVVGYYHSHPDAPAEPSAFDREHAWPWYVYLIVGVAKGRAAESRAWRLADDRGEFEAVQIDGTG